MTFLNATLAIDDPRQILLLCRDCRHALRILLLNIINSIKPLTIFHKTGLFIRIQKSQQKRQVIHTSVQGHRHQHSA